MVASPWAKPRLVEMGVGQRKDHGTCMEWLQSMWMSGLLLRVTNRDSSSRSWRCRRRAEARCRGKGPADTVESGSPRVGEAVPGDEELWQDGLGRAAAGLASMAAATPVYK